MGIAFRGFRSSKTPRSTHGYLLPPLTWLRNRRLTMPLMQFEDEKPVFTARKFMRLIIE